MHVRIIATSMCLKIPVRGQRWCTANLNIIRCVSVIHPKCDNIQSLPYRIYNIINSKYCRPLHLKITSSLYSAALLFGLQPTVNK